MENHEKLKLRRDISHYWPEIAYEDFVDNLPTELRMCSFTHVFMDRVKSEDIFYRVRWGYLDKLDKVRGTLFFEVARILEAKHPRYVLLENVQNLVSHDDGKTYKTICETLRSLGYRIPASPLILQPYQFGIPQIRPRVYIPGIYDPCHANEPLVLDLGQLLDKKDVSVLPILEQGVTDPNYALSRHEIDVLDCWDEFHRGLDAKTIGFPVWSWCFDLGEAQKALAEPDIPDWKAERRKGQEAQLLPGACGDGTDSRHWAHETLYDRQRGRETPIIPRNVYPGRKQTTRIQTTWEFGQY